MADKYANCPECGETCRRWYGDIEDGEILYDCNACSMFFEKVAQPKEDPNAPCRTKEGQATALLIEALDLLLEAAQEPGAPDFYLADAIDHVGGALNGLGIQTGD